MPGDLTHSVFQLTPDSELPASTIASELSTLKTIVTKSFYENLLEEQKAYLHGFLWITMHSLWKHPSPQVRLASSSALGSVLISLGPFYSNELLLSLRETISTTTGESFLLLACFSFLSKFQDRGALEQILSETPILHLFGKDGAEYLPVLVKEILHLPRDFLLTLAEFFVNLSIANTSNRHFPRAAAIIIETEPDVYIDVIKANTPLVIITALFPDRLPLLSPEILTVVKERSFTCIASDNAAATEYESACVCLNLMVNNGQVRPAEIRERVTNEVFSKSGNLGALLLLPVDESLVRTLYTYARCEDDTMVVSSLDDSSFSQTETACAELETENRYVQPLMTYFSKNPQFRDELAALLRKHICVSSGMLSNALAVIGETYGLFADDVLNDLLLRVFNLRGSNWVMKLWVLKMVQKLNFQRLDKDIIEHAFELIEGCALDKSEALRQTAKEVAVMVFRVCKVETFKIFIDKFVRKFDIFDRVLFEQRLSFVAYVFENTDAQWSNSFIHIANLLVEAISLFSFSEKVMMDMFSIIGILSQGLRESGTILRFVRPALIVIENSYAEFVGESLGLWKPFFFDCDAIPAYHLEKIDTDLTSNPSAWHTVILRCAESAFGLLTRMQLNEFEFQAEEFDYLFNFACRLLNLFPSKANQLVANIVDVYQIPFGMMKEFIRRSVIISRGRDALSCGFLLSGCLKNYPMLDLGDVTEFVKLLRSEFLVARNLDFSDIIAIKRVLEKYEMEVSDDECLCIIRPCQKHMLLEKSSSSSGAEEKEEALAEVPDFYADFDPQSFNSSVLIQVNDTPVAPSLLAPSTNLLQSVQSLTPFYACNTEIPEELFVTPLITSFCRNSTQTLTSRQAEDLFMQALVHGTIRCVFDVLSFFQRKKILFDLRPYLNHQYMSSRSMFPAVFWMISAPYKSWKELGAQEAEFVSRFVGESPLDFILNANLKVQRNLAVVLLQFDTVFFMSKLLEVKKIRSNHIINLLLYIDAGVEFPAYDFFLFCVSVIQTNAQSRKKKHLARRLMSVFLYKNMKDVDVVKNAAKLLSYDVNKEQTMKERTCGDLIELYYEAMVLSNVVDCQAILNPLLRILKKSTVYGMNMYLHINSPTVDTINSICASPLSSMNMLPYRYYAATMRQNTPISYHILEALLSGKIEKHAIHELTVLQFVNKFIYCYLSSRKITASQKKAVYQFFMNTMNRDVKYGLLKNVLQTLVLFMPMFDAKSPAIPEILTFVESVFSLNYVPTDACELLCQCCNKLRKHEHAVKVFNEHLCHSNSYWSQSVASYAAKYALKVNGFSEEVRRIMPTCKSFFATFCGIVDVERECPNMNHDSMKGLFSASHNRALILLSDEKMRPFAPVFALSDGDVAELEELSEYIKQTEKLLK